MSQEVGLQITRTDGVALRRPRATRRGEYDGGYDRRPTNDGDDDGSVLDSRTAATVGPSEFHVLFELEGAHQTALGGQGAGTGGDGHWH